MSCQGRDLNKCFSHSLLFFFLVCNRIYTLAAMETGRIEKEKNRGKGDRKERRKKGKKGGERKKKEDAISVSHIYSDL